MNLEASRNWYKPTLPSTRPTNFVANKDVMILDNGLSYIWTTTWVEVILPFKGKDGKDGVNGINGANGTNGKDGLQGIQGIPGPQGPQGVPGSSTGGSANVGGVRWVTNWNELLATWTELTAGVVRSINLAGNITVLQPLVIPANLNKIIEINGHGFELNVDSSIACVFKREYVSLSDANMGIDLQLRITNVEFISKGTPRVNNAIDIQATYGTEIKGCRFRNFNSAIKGCWTMGTIIDQCFFWENNISIELDYARFVNGSNSASQSNHTIISNCKFRHTAGQFGAIKATAVSGLMIIHNIFEGVQAGPEYCVYFNDDSASVVKEVYMYGNHVEQIPSVAGFYIRLKEGFAKCGGIFSQYDCTLIKFESSAYAKMVVDTIPFLTAGTKFQNVLSTGRWDFTNMPSAFAPTTATYWVGGVAPINSKYEAWDPNGQQPAIYLSTRKL